MRSGLSSGLQEPIELPADHHPRARPAHALALTIQAQSCARDLVRSADVRIVEIAYSPVKGLGLLYPSEVELTALGVASNRRFFLVDEHLQMVNGKRLGKLVQGKPELDEAENRLTLRFPEGGLVSDVVELGEPVETSFLGRPRPGRLVNGPWGVALSEWAGQPLRLVAPAAGPGGGLRGGGGGGGAVPPSP